MERRSKAKGTVHSKIQTYLTTSAYFLEHRIFEDCRKYALKAIEIDPNLTAPSQILAIAKVLMLSSTENEDPNYYSILDLPLYTQDQQLIKTNFKNVTNVLNPNQNQYPFASEAFKVVLKAWSVLSNPTQKTRFDNGLKTKEKRGTESGGGSNNTFWTICPYCYYVYEFIKDYEDCCMRCQNEKCRRGFHALPIAGPPPPPEVAEKGEYHCYGFSVLGIQGKSLWSPFVPEKKNDEGQKDENGEKEKSLGVEEKFVKTMGGNLKKKRIKMVAKSSKKVLGKGNRVNMNEVVYNNEGENSEVELGNTNVEEKTNNNQDNIGIFVGDDNDGVYVNFQDDDGDTNIGTLFF